MARPTDSNEQLLCSFCGKSQRQVKKLIAGPGVYICDECIDLCNEIIDEELTAPPTFDIDNLPKPREIYGVLNEYVVGQEQAKRTLSVAVYNHYKRVQMMQADDSDIELQKSNILLLGPTGCGKTLLAQTLARILNVPFAIADATALTEAGYVGEDVENILLKVIQRRVGHKGVGFAAAIESKLERDKGEVFEQCLPEDLVNYGLIPEFVGRLPVVSAIHQLSRDDLVTILTEPRNALVKQFQKFFSFDAIELVFAEDSLESIADKALARETGARGLRSILEETLLDVQFELPSRRDVKKCVVTKETIEKGLKPTLVTEAAPDEDTGEHRAESA